MIAPIVLALLLRGSDGSAQQRELLSTVTIVGDCARDCGRGNTVFGAGEIVGRSADGELVVVTARHVVAAMSRPRVYLLNGSDPGARLETYRRKDDGRSASVEATSNGADLALVRFRLAPGDRYAVAPLSNGAPPQGGNVIGHPYGDAWTVSSFHFMNAMQEAFVVRCPTCGPGDSGGGVFDTGGRLCGIIVSEERTAVRDDARGFDERTARFAVVPMGQVRSFIAFEAREAAGIRQASNPWTHFGVSAPTRDANPWSAAAWSHARPNDPWSRFAGSPPAVER
jgi:hypothetical protein